MKISSFSKNYSENITTEDTEYFSDASLVSYAPAFYPGENPLLTQKESHPITFITNKKLLQPP